MIIVAWVAFGLVALWVARSWRPGPREDPGRKKQANWFAVIGLVLVALGALGRYLAEHHETLTQLLSRGHG